MIHQYEAYCFLLLDNEAQLQNRHHNAALLRFVDSVRTHGHRAARIDPLDLIPRDSEVAALDPSRYGLRDGNQRYNVNGIIWTNPKVEDQRNDVEEWWTLDEITRHLRDIYVGRIAYEVYIRVHDSQILPSLTCMTVYALAVEDRTSLVLSSS